MTSRLFIAIPLPEGVVTELHSLQQGLKGTRWVPEEQMHLTLRFLGDVDEARIPLLKEQLGSIVIPSFDLTVQGLGCFPPRGVPRVLWAGVLPSPPLQELATILDHELAAAGFPREPRPFSPHLTLGRFRSVEENDVTRYLTLHRDFSLSPFVVNRFILFCSRLTSTGAEHTPLARYPLHP